LRGRHEWESYFSEFRVNPMDFFIKCIGLAIIAYEHSCSGRRLYFRGRRCYVLSGVSVAEQLDEYCTQTISV
ncbi:hypothetical protein, partial [Acetobacter aceti]|uniref:hypothetical protein n=1 Tax=Acetobacter aceti TaxID=435 RepID=UPI0019D6D557